MDPLRGNNTAARIGYIDIAKCIAILAVIAGHYYAPPLLAGKVIYSFHMPLFFIVSGFFVKDYQIKKNVIRSCKGLLLPYAAGMGIKTVIDIFAGKDLQGLDAARQGLIDMIGGMCKVSAVFPVFRDVGMLWFLPCLFVCRVLFVVIMNVTEKSKYSSSIRIIVFSLLAFVGMATPRLTYEYFPWGAEIALVSLLFLFCGNMLNKHKVFDDRRRLPIAGICLVIWIVLLSLGFYIELAAHYWPGFYLAVLEGMLASFAVMCLSQLIDKIRFLNTALRWIGKSSLIVLLVHYIDSVYEVSDKLLGILNIDHSILSLTVRILFILCIAGDISLLLQMVKARSKVRSANG